MGEYDGGPLAEPPHPDSELDRAGDLDAVARTVLHELGRRPGVTRVGIALTEGGGRRLRFLPSDAGSWCHVDAYDDVPLTRVVRTGEPLAGGLDDFGGRFAGFLQRQRDAGTRALAALPLPGEHAPIGGLIVYFDRAGAPDDAELSALEEAARRTARAIRRVRGLDAEEHPHDEDEHPHRASVRLASDPRAAREARAFLRDLLATWRIGEEVVDSAELCVSELVTNAVVHAGTSSLLTVALEDELLTVAVRDRGVGEAPAMVEDHDPLKVFGRGLQLVDALSERWGTEHDGAGTVSWFALRVGAAA